MKKDYEKRGIIISMIGSFLLSVSALIMAIVAESQAIMLDGMYTLITLLMSLVSLKVINLVNLPETKRSPFGYVALEPFLNLTKSLIILVMLAVCFVANIQALFSGGREIILDLATYYTLICICIYFFVIFLIKRCKQKTDSSILVLEVKNWYIDTFITVGIAVSLAVVLIVYKLGYTNILPYIDPSLVLIIVLVSLPVPIKAFVIELKRLLLISPENYIESNIKEYINPVTEKYGLKNINIYAVKIGRIYQIFIYANLKTANISLDLLDEIRMNIRKELSKHFSRHYTDVIFSKVDS